MNTKYTDEILSIVDGCVSVREALSRLGLKPDGGHRGLRRLLKERLSKSKEYKGQGYLKGKRYFKKSNEEFFSNSELKRNTFNVRNALFNRNIKGKVCESCSLSEWLGNSIPLEVHHIDGNNQNNELSNLQVLCPNCHYFTDTYKTKNIKKAPISQSR